MKKVLLSKAIDPVGMEILKGKVEALVLPDTAIETVKSMAADADAIILRTNIRVTREIIAAAPKLKVISRTGVGVDNVDVDTATEKGILICNTPGVNSNSVAEQTVALLLGLAKQLKMMDRAVSVGNWKIRNSGRAVDLSGKILGVIALGRIGMEVARKCRLAFNMNVIAYDPYVKEAEGVELCSSPDPVFSQADFVSLHVPYSQATHHLVDSRLLGLMKPASFLINTSRGAVIDEKALIAVLEKGSIAGAGLDVFEDEPPSQDNPLPKMENVIVTPHSSALSRECVAKVARKAAQAVVDFLEGRRPKYIYNQEQLALK